ncbi:SDR family NAD(P)-dependent oxidoreductase [Streptomyces sp. NPDC020951]|uniref:SDR family NAD(P)-dependent oxidoreductase n=1 Tax=Streptomyces sp. NPDC020951 TaxID=3365104 RepID=UPI00379E17AC
MRVFITGGSGYIGRATIAALHREGHDVFALARTEEAARTVSELGATAVRGSLTDTDVLREAASRADGAIHLGATQGADPADIDRAAAEAIQDGIGGSPYVHTGGAQQFSGAWARRELGRRPTRQDALTVLAQG